MTDTQKRIAIAEALGWKKIYRGPEYCDRWVTPNRLYATDMGLPRIDDHNALADARNQTIDTPDLKIRWVNTLRDVVGLTSTRRNKAGQALVSDIDLLFATPGQLADALGVTLKLWGMKDVRENAPTQTPT